MPTEPAQSEDLVTTIELNGSDPARIKADAVVVGLVKRDDGFRLAAGALPIEAAYGRTLRAVLKSLGATGSQGQVVKLPRSGKVSAPVVAAVGLGTDPTDQESLRRAAGAAVRALAGHGRVVLALPATNLEATRAVCDGALYGAYAFLGYRKDSAADHKKPVSAITVATDLADTKAATTELNEARIISRAVHLARDLINTPPSDLHPKEFGDAAVAACRSLKLEVEVLDQRALARGKFGGILAVGQGSTNPPRLVRIAYRSTKPQQNKRHLALVGKGITFDSGGISLKPPAQMDLMKSDMSGAAAVLAAMTAIARLKPAIDVTGWMPLAENMPSGAAQRPSDVITIRGGKTVEVLNTDAEGRLVLADGIVRASEESPDVIVDAATLTGAAMVALGMRTAGIMANDDALRDQLHTIASRVGEQTWPMPLPKDLRPAMDSSIADIANLGDRYGGMLTAGLFLAEFVPDGISWAHLDIAGPAYNAAEPFGYTPKGGTGSAVRVMVELARELAKS
ncbi:MAG TPA: leucyl aminopeptidase [Actinomycetes bacterium]|nr:leucyl aminopeptidase [Actinomycetes bacterium]